MSDKIKYQDTEKDRSRVWAFEVYPDSVDPDWKNYLAESLIHSYISPFHDKDIDEGNVPKKGHYHIMLMYETVMYPHQVIQDIIDIAGGGVGGCNITEDFDEHKLVDIVPIRGSKRKKWQGISNFGKSFGIIVKIQSKSGMARYLCHMDNADKYQYDPADVQVFGKPDYLEVCGSQVDRYEMLREMRVFCKENNIVYFGDLYDYADENRHEDWFKVLCDSGTYVMDRYIKALHYKLKDHAKIVERQYLEDRHKELNDPD